MASKHPENYCPAFGNYPKEYNRAVHGAFHPMIDYRTTKDIQLSEVKLGELGAWISRRPKTPAAAIAAMSRTYWRWNRHWMSPRYASLSKSLFQVITIMSVSSLLLSYGYYKAERTHKYHW